MNKNYSVSAGQPLLQVALKRKPNTNLKQLFSSFSHAAMLINHSSKTRDCKVVFSFYRKRDFDRSFHNKEAKSHEATFPLYFAEACQTRVSSFNRLVI